MYYTLVVDYNEFWLGPNDLWFERHDTLGDAVDYAKSQDLPVTTSIEAALKGKCMLIFRGEIVDSNGDPQ
jgi:hypothetical protein